MRISTSIRRFRDREEGVALVEFAMFLPLFLLALFVIIEFSRLFITYQGAVAGVRDAARYMSRTVASDICETTSGAGAVFLEQTTPAGQYFAIVSRNMDTEVDNLLPRLVTLNSVNRSVACVSHATDPDRYRQAQVPMAQVTANFTVVFPLVGVLEINGIPLINSITRDISDMSRVYGV